MNDYIQVRKNPHDPQISYLKYLPSDKGESETGGRGKHFSVRT